MISPISFTSTYKVDYHNPEAYEEFRKYARKFTTKKPEAQYNYKDYFTQKHEYVCEQTLIVPDKYDIDVEGFCANHHISYTKHDTKDLLNTKYIGKRIKDAPEGYKKADIDVEKLEKLMQRQFGNINDCRSGVYDKHQDIKDKVNYMLKSGEKFPTTSLFIINRCNPTDKDGIEDLRRYVETYGVNNLNNEQVGLDFVQKTDDPDHCIFFALKDLGMKKIPVYVNESSYEMGKILGLFEED